MSFSKNLKIRGKWGPRGILCTRGEKEHASKRVSVIVRDNVISKAKRATRTLEFSEPRKKHQKSIKFSVFNKRNLRLFEFWQRFTL